MFAASPAPSVSFSYSSVGDGSLYHYPQQQQLCSRLGLDQATTASSFPVEGGLPHHRLDVASSLSSFPTLSRSAAHGDLLLLRQHRHIRHGFANQAATHLHCLSWAGKGAACGAHQHSRHVLSVQASTILLSSSQALHNGLHGHRVHRQLQQHALRIHTSRSSSSVAASAGHCSLLQQEQNHIRLTFLSTFAHSVCVGNGGDCLQQQQISTRLQAYSQQHLGLQEEQERLLQRQQRLEVIKKHEEDILESIVAHQESLKNSALSLSNSQIEPNAAGYVPPEFDTNSCRSVFVGNIHRKVTANFLEQVFSTVGTLAGCKLIKKRKSSYGIMEYLDHRAAAVAIATLNGRQLFNLPIKVNWAYSKELKEDNSGHHTIYVGDLSRGITDVELFTFFSAYPSRSDVRIMWDQRSGRSKGFGFVSFREREDAEKAIEEMTGKMLGGTAVRCNWAAGIKKDSEVQKVIVKKSLKNDPRCSTVYIGKLPDEVTEDKLRKEFDMLGVGVVEGVLILDDKNCGFVKYSTHEEAALAISSAKGKIFEGKPVVCSWGRQRNPSGVSPKSHPLAAAVLSPEHVTPLEDVKTE